MKTKYIASALLVAGITGSTLTTVADASAYLNGKVYARTATKSTKAKRTVKVYKVTTGKAEYQNKWKAYGHLRKGSKVKRSGNIMSTEGWIISSPKKYHATKRTFYIIPSGAHKWYTR